MSLLQPARSLWMVIKPGLWGEDRIRCTHCHCVLSLFWKTLPLAIVLGAGVSQVGLVRWLDFGWLVDRVLITAAMFLTLLLAYGFIPLARVENE